MNAMMVVTVVLVTLKTIGIVPVSNWPWIAVATPALINLLVIILAAKMSKDKIHKNNE